MRPKASELLKKFLIHFGVLVIIPNLTSLYVQYGNPTGWLGIIIGTPIFFGPYYILPFVVSGGHGFIGPIGVGPDGWEGYLIAILFWTVISFFTAKIHLYIKQKKSEANHELDHTA